MIPEAGLFDGIVLQRDEHDASDAVFSGKANATGRVRVTVRQNNKKLKGFKSVDVGRAAGGAFKGRLTGLPVGGPYSIVLKIVDSKDDELASAKVRDVYVGDVWILAGQSNMQGAGRLQGRPKALAKVRAFYMNDGWGPAEDPIHNLDAAVDPVHRALSGGELPPRNKVVGAGPGVGFGQAMYRATGIPQGLLACGHGGTSLAQWSAALKNEGGHSLYGAMLRRFVRNGSKVAGVVWYQGCSETTPELRAAYTGRMQALVAALREDMKVPVLPFVLVQLARVVMPGDPASWNAVQDQQRQLPGLIQHCSVVPAIDLELDDFIHLSGASVVRLGERIAYAMRVLKYGRKAGRPPIAFKRFELVRDPLYALVDIIIDFDHVAGKLKSGDRASGFSVIGRGNTDFVYRADLEGHRIRLRTGLCDTTRDLAGTQLWYGHGYDPFCNIVDGADRSLPVFGPIEIRPPRALMPLFSRAWVSRAQPTAGRLGALAYPVEPGALGFEFKRFPNNFLDVRSEIANRAPEDLLFFFRVDLACAEAMKLAALLGYDGPLKCWVDGVQIYHDPDGMNPSIPDEETVLFDVGPGRHELMLALGSNHGRAWGVYLGLERVDVSRECMAENVVVFPVPVERQEV